MPHTSTGNGDAFFELTEKLPKCPDLEYIVASCLVQIPKYGTQCGSADKCQTLITKVLGLKKAVCKVEEMHDALASLDATKTSTEQCLLLDLFREALKSPLVEELRGKIDMVCVCVCACVRVCLDRTLNTRITQRHGFVHMYVCSLPCRTHLYHTGAR